MKCRNLALSWTTTARADNEPVAGSVQDPTAWISVEVAVPILGAISWQGSITCPPLATSMAHKRPTVIGVTAAAANAAWSGTVAVLSLSLLLAPAVAELETEDGSTVSSAAVPPPLSALYAYHAKDVAGS